jgi:putative restriction endonuclease
VVKAVLTTKVDPTYDDMPEKRYHFPQTYLRQVAAAIGDWIVYGERPAT